MFSPRAGRPPGRAGSSPPETRSSAHPDQVVTRPWTIHRHRLFLPPWRSRGRPVVCRAPVSVSPVRGCYVLCPWGESFCPRSGENCCPGSGQDGRRIVRRPSSSAHRAGVTDGVPGWCLPLRRPRGRLRRYSTSRSRRAPARSSAGIRSEASKRNDVGSSRESRPCAQGCRRRRATVSTPLCGVRKPGLRHPDLVRDRRLEDSIMARAASLSSVIAQTVPAPRTGLAQILFLEGGESRRSRNRSSSRKKVGDRTTPGPVHQAGRRPPRTAVWGLLRGVGGDDSAGDIAVYSPRLRASSEGLDRRRPHVRPSKGISFGDHGRRTSSGWA